MKSFDEWKKQYESGSLEPFTADEQGFLWLKLKSIFRKQLLVEFTTGNQINLAEKTLNRQFAELYDLLSQNPIQSHQLLNDYINSKNQKILAELDTQKLISELYKLKVFDWGGDHHNSLDNYLVSHYVKSLQSYDLLVAKFEQEINRVVQGYVLNSWYNHWSSVLIEHIFKAHPSVLPAIGQIKYVDFFLGAIPFDLKVTYLPAEYIKAKRKEFGWPVELTYLKAKARALDIDYDKNAKESDIYYELVEKLKDKGSSESLSVIEQLRKEKLQILAQAQQNPRIVANWLYENQGEMRFGSENRIFLVLVDTQDFSGSWKLKRNIDLLKPTINNYLDEFSKKNISDLTIKFRYKGKPQLFTALADVIFIVK